VGTVTVRDPSIHLRVGRPYEETNTSLSAFGGRVDQVVFIEVPQSIEPETDQEKSYSPAASHPDCLAILTQYHSTC
jgi:hypothetical protein